MQKYYFWPKAQACNNARWENHITFTNTGQLSILAEEGAQIWNNLLKSFSIFTP